MDREKTEVTFEMIGDRALFTDPSTKIGGDKRSYPIPTYQAVKSILKSIYWKPTFIWFIDDVRVMNPIRTREVGTTGVLYNAKSGNDLFYYTYLENVRYQVRAHFEFNYHQVNMAHDRKPKKHRDMTERRIEKGGMCTPYFGTSECFGYVKPCVFGESDSAYDHTGSIPFGTMYHSKTYPDEAYNKETEGKVTKHLWSPVMTDGIIHYLRPEECPIHIPIKECDMHVFEDNRQKREKDLKEYKECLGEDA